MKTLSRILFTLLLCSMYTNLWSQTFDWVTNPGTDATDSDRGMAMDNSGNIYTIGNLWPSGGAHFLCGGVGTGEVMMKYNSSGACQWKVLLTGTGTSVATYGSYVYVCGYMGTPGANSDLFVDQYNASTGALVASYYATTVVGSTSSAEAYGISATSFGVFVCGSIYNKAIFYSQDNYGGVANTVNLGSARFGLFVMKLDPATMDLAWYNVPSGTGSSEALAISNSPATGYSYVTGYYNNTAFSGTTLLTSTGGQDAFVGKIMPDGSAWNWTVGGGSTNVASQDKGTCIIVSPVNTGLVFFGGVFPSSGTLFGNTLTNGWLAKISTANTGYLAVNTGGTNTNAVSVDGSGAVYCGGSNYINKYTINLASTWSVPLVNANTYVSGLASNSCYTYFSGSIYFPPGTCSLTMGSNTLQSYAFMCTSGERDWLLGRISTAFALTSSGVNCVSTTFTLNATPGFTSYVWTPNVGNTASVTASPCIQNTSTYSVTASNATCSYTTSIQAKPKVTVSINAGNCMGLAQTFTATTNSCALSPVTYQWKKNGGNVGGNTSSYNTVSPHGGSYNVVVTSVTGCSATSNTSVIDCSCCRFSDNADSESDYKIFPNPNSGNFTITGLAVGDKLSVVNVSGQEVYHVQITENMEDMEINLNNISKGIYLLKIENSQKTEHRQFVID